MTWLHACSRCTRSLCCHLSILHAVRMECCFLCGTLVVCRCRAFEMAVQRFGCTTIITSIRYAYTNFLISVDDSL